MKIPTKQTLEILYTIAWLVFIGVCIDAGGLIFNTFYSMVLNPNGAKDFWYHVDLSGVYSFDESRFFKEASIMSIIGIMKAIIFYLIVKVLHDKKLNLDQPFNTELKKIVVNI